jgi:hypothetical protein
MATERSPISGLLDDSCRCPCDDDAIFWLYADAFFKKFHKVPSSQLVFFTFKDNKQRYTNIDKPRKWCHRWSDSYIIVRSPVGGYHFHGVAHRIPSKKIRYLKGLHIMLEPLGSKAENIVIPESPPECIEDEESHPYISDPVVSRYFMRVMSELRSVFGKYKSSLMKRVKARKARKRLADSRCEHLSRVLWYLYKNFTESDRSPLTDVVYKIT